MLNCAQDSPRAIPGKLSSRDKKPHQRCIDVLRGLSGVSSDRKFMRQSTQLRKPAVWGLGFAGLGVGMALEFGALRRQVTTKSSEYKDPCKNDPRRRRGAWICLRGPRRAPTPPNLKPFKTAACQILTSEDEKRHLRVCGFRVYGSTHGFVALALGFRGRKSALWVLGLGAMGVPHLRAGHTPS